MLFGQEDAVLCQGETHGLFENKELPAPRFSSGLFQKKEGAGLAEAEQVPRCSPEPDKVDERSVTRPRQEPSLHRLAAQSTRGSLVGEGSLFGSNNFPCINSQASRFCLWN